MLLGLGSYIFRYSVGTKDFRPNNPLDPVQLVEKAADLGAELVQFAENLPLDDVEDTILDRVKDIASTRGITLEAGTAGAIESKLCRHLEIAQQLDAKLVRVSLSHGNFHPSKEEAVATIRSVLPKYRDASITLAIENHFTMSSEDLRFIVDSIDNPLVGICLDVANSIANKEWPEETIRIIGPYAKCLHLKDYKLEMNPNGLGVNARGTPLGEGLQDVRFLIDYVKSVNPNANVVLEQWMPPEDSVEETLRKEERWIKNSLSFAREVMGK